MGMSIVRIPIPNTQIPNLVGYNTNTLIVYNVNCGNSGQSIIRDK